MDTKKLLESIFNRALLLWEYGTGIHSHPNEKIVFGPSSTHACPRKVILNAVHGHPRGMPRQSEATMVGTNFHDKMDQLMDMALWELAGQVIRIAPFKLICLERDIAEVSGTPDHLYLILTNGKPQLVQVDFKHPKDFAVTKAKKGEVSVGYKGQLAMYAHGLVLSPLGQMLGLNNVADMDCLLLQVSRNNYRKYHITQLEDIGFQHTQAMVYWNSVLDQLGQYLKDDETKESPSANTQVLGQWQCGYCNWNRACLLDGEIAVDQLDPDAIKHVVNEVGRFERNGAFQGLGSNDLIELAQGVSLNIAERRSVNDDG